MNPLYKPKSPPVGRKSLDKSASCCSFRFVAAWLSNKSLTCFNLSINAFNWAISLSNILTAIVDTTLIDTINKAALFKDLTILVIKLTGTPTPGGTAVGIGIADSTATIAVNIAIYNSICLIICCKLDNLLILLLIKVTALFLKLVAILIVSGVLACSI